METIRQKLDALAGKLLDAAGELKVAEGEKKTALRAFDSLRKKWADLIRPLEDEDARLRAEILALVEEDRARHAEALRQYAEAVRKERPEAATLFSSIEGDWSFPGIVLVERDAVEVTHPKRLPLAYLCPDEAKIKKDALAGVEIPGVRVFKKLSIQVR